MSRLVVMRGCFLPLILFACAGDLFAKSDASLVCSGPNWELRVGRGAIRRIPLQSDPGDLSPEGFAALSIERGNRWFEYLRDTQATIDWWAGEIVPEGSLKDTLRWDGHLAFVLADPADTVTAEVVASSRCGDLWAGCQPVHLERGYQGRFADIAAPHPRRGPCVRVYLGVPVGRVPEGRVIGIFLKGGRL